MTDDQGDAQQQLEYAAQQAAAYLQEIHTNAPTITAGEAVLVLLTQARDRRDLGEPVLATALIALAERVACDFRHHVITAGMAG